MSGKWALHPSQIDAALEIFTPALADVENARALIKAYEEAVAQGLGAVNVNGQFADAATARLLGNVLKRAEILGM